MRLQVSFIHWLKKHSISDVSHPCRQAYGITEIVKRVMSITFFSKEYHSRTVEFSFHTILNFPDASTNSYTHCCWTRLTYCFIPIILSVKVSTDSHWNMTNAIIHQNYIIALKEQTTTILLKNASDSSRIVAKTKVMYSLWLEVKNSFMFR